MEDTNRFEQEVSKALGIFPTPDTIARERFRQAFDSITSYQEHQTLRQLSKLLQKVMRNLVKFGGTAIYDEELLGIVTTDGEGGTYALSDELIAFRRGALRDLIAMGLRRHGYTVTRKKDGAPRIVVSLVERA